jgi:hypothetical protein
VSGTLEEECDVCKGGSDGGRDGCFLDSVVNQKKKVVIEMNWSEYLTWWDITGKTEYTDESLKLGKKPPAKGKGHSVQA